VSNQFVCTWRRLLISKPSNKAGRKQPAKSQKLTPPQVSQVRQLISSTQEHKFIDTKLFATAATTTAQQFAIASIPQGDTDSARDGDRVKLIGLEFRFDTYLQGFGGTNDFTNTVRLTFYQYRPMSSGSHPVIADIYQDSNSVAQSPTSSAFNWDNRADYKILYDRRFFLSGNGPAVVGENVVRVPLKGCIQYSSGSNTLGQNQLFYIMSSDSLVATHPLINIYTRVTYTDAWVVWETFIRCRKRIQIRCENWKRKLSV